MVKLIWEAQDFIMDVHPTVQARYDTFEAAFAQAAHDLALGRHPLRIEDATTGEVLWRVGD